MTAGIGDSAGDVWSSRAKAFAYSDGDEVEAYLLATLKQASDVSASSEQLMAAIKDWPSEYHLSPARHNLLRPFAFTPRQRVLELGCGCGAMTRYIGETGATVVAIEGSERRAEIAAERCRDLQNVEICCENLINFRSEEKFDFVTLIGVLEYAPRYIDSPDPIGACLEHARTFLKEDGALILAIENQLGLKYFNGCKEDHAGIPYFGINNLYGQEDPSTLGRRALSVKLRQHGFPVQEFYYPFPDYKLPGLILSEAALMDARLNIPDLLIHNVGRDYPETHYRAFAEDLTWQVVVENGLLPDLANSFLIVARSAGAAVASTGRLATLFNRGQRRPRYQIETTIEARGNGGLVVRKRMINPNAPAEEGWLCHVVKDSDYISGSLLIGKIHRAMAREADIDELAACFAPWIKFLLKHTMKNKEGKLLLPGDFVDCVPANLIEDIGGTLCFFDAEWVCRDPIPFAWVMVRGICNALAGAIENQFVTRINFRQLIDEITRQAGPVLTDADFAVADSLESLLMSSGFPKSDRKDGFSGNLDKPLAMTQRLSGSAPELRWSLIHAEAEIKRVKSTVSWRITSPLRVAWNLLRRICR